MEGSCMRNRNTASGGRCPAASPLVTTVLCSVIVVVVLALFHVAVAQAGGDRDATTCMSNMNQIGRAIKSYLTDWEDVFPTNRNRKNVMTREIRLSEESPDMDVRFKYGVNWVEALYPYIEKVGDPQDNARVWRCPLTREKSYPAGSKSACNSYAFNFNLITAPESALRVPANTMLVREMDRGCYAVCRPVNISCDATHRPKGAFLTASDPLIGKTDPVLHDGCSHVLFADGHVKLVTSRIMPSDDKLYFDKKTKMWWNLATKAIALNP
jgi:prepilin-type processing-associated H-X9-DG protein